MSQSSFENFRISDLKVGICYHSFRGLPSFAYLIILVVSKMKMDKKEIEGRMLRHAFSQHRWGIHLLSAMIAGIFTVCSV